MPCQLCDGPNGPLCPACEAHILRSRIDREPPPHWIREGK
jgi:hypothetical protein